MNEYRLQNHWPAAAVVLAQHFSCAPCVVLT